MPLTNKQQLIVAQEPQEAVPISNVDLAVAGNASFLVIDPKITYDVQRYQRQIKRSSLTPLAGLSGLRTGTLTFGLELTASGTVATTPFPLQFDLLLAACGMRRGGLQRLTVGAITGADVARHMDTVSGGTSGATGRVVADLHEGDTTLWTTRSDGLGTGNFQAAEVVTFGSGATVTTSAVQLQAGVGYWPYSDAVSRLVYDATGLTEDVEVGDVLRGNTSGALFQVFAAAVISASTTVYVKRLTGHVTGGETVKNLRTTNNNGTLFATTDGAESQVHIPTLSMGVAHDGVFKSISAARGTVTGQANIGEPGILNFEFRGLVNEPSDLANVPDVTYAQRVPPVFLGASCKVGNYTDLLLSAEVEQCISALTFSLQNQLGYRRCANAVSGLLEAIISGRAPQASIDPEMLPEAIFPWTGQFLNNRLSRLRAQIGTTSPDKFHLRLPAGSVREEPTGDRDGTATRQVGLDLTSGSQSVGAGDNELILIWHAQ